MNYLDELKKNYNIDFKSMISLTGGWLNEKFVVTSTIEKKYVLKELSMKKFPTNYIKILINTIEIQNELYNQNILVPKLIINKSKKLVSTFSDNRLFYLQEFVNGETKASTNITNEEVYSIGKNLALLHLSLKKMNIKPFNSNFLKFKSVIDLNESLTHKKENIDSSSSQLYIMQLNNCEKIINDLKKTNFLEQQELQLIHGDFTLDNIILFNNEVKAIIDFELVRINSKLQDIGRCILSCSFDNGNFDILKFKNFLLGYSSVEGLTKSQIIDSLKIVWINEFDIWIQDKYFKNYNPPKVENFIKEIMWIGNNWFDLKKIIGGMYNEFD